MKKDTVLIAVFLVVLSSCSIQKLAYSSVADALAPETQTKKKNDSKTNPMEALTGENDPQLVADFFPAALKIYDMLLIQNPSHVQLGIMTGQLYIMYANAFIQSPAEELPFDQFDIQNKEFKRAQNLYLRGNRYVLTALDYRYKGFTSSLFSIDSTKRTRGLMKCTKKDAEALYWAGAGALAAFALDPINTDLLDTLEASVAMLERSAELDNTYNAGAVYEVLMAYYAAAPDTLGGSREKALVCYNKALEISKGESPSLFIGYAKALCIPVQDSKGFDVAINKALAIDPESKSENRLILTIAHRQALWLRDNKSNFILDLE